MQAARAQAVVNEDNSAVRNCVTLGPDTKGVVPVVESKDASAGVPAEL